MTLHSLHPPKAKLSLGSLSNSLVDDHEAHCSSSKEVILSEGHLKGLKPQHPPTNGEKDRRTTVLNLSKRMDSCFWWYRSITLKLGNTRVVISNGKIMLGCLIFLVYYIFRRKRATLKRYDTLFLLVYTHALISNVTKRYPMTRFHKHVTETMLVNTIFFLFPFLL